MKVIIDGIEYVPKSDILSLTENRLKKCIKHLVGIHFADRDHRSAMVMGLLDELSPELANLIRDNPHAAFDRILGNDGFWLDIYCKPDCQSATQRII